MNDIAVPQQRPEATTALKKVKSWKVVTIQDRSELDAYLVGLSKLEKLIVSDFEEPRKKATEAFNAAKAATSALKAQEERHLQPIQEARRAGKQLIASFDQEQDRLRLAAEAEINEKKRKLDEERKQSEALLAEQAGDTAEADRILNRKDSTPPITLARTTPKTATVIRKVNKYRILDAQKLKREYLLPDTSLIGQLVRSKGQAAEALVGEGAIEVYQEVV